MVDHVPKETTFPNGGYIWIYGKIGISVLEPNRNQKRAKNCVNQAVTLSTYYRHKMKHLRQGLRCPSMGGLIYTPYDIEGGSRFESILNDGQRFGFKDTTGRQIKISHYKMTNINYESMVTELTQNGPFPVCYFVYTNPCYKRYYGPSGINVYCKPPQGQEIAICVHVVTVVGHGNLDGDKVWAVQDSYGIDGTVDIDYISHDVVIDFCYAYVSSRIDDFS